jgi:hypothetical protein
LLGELTFPEHFQPLFNGRVVIADDQTIQQYLAWGYPITNNIPNYPPYSKKNDGTGREIGKIKNNDLWFRVPAARIQKNSALLAKPSDWALSAFGGDKWKGCSYQAVSLDEYLIPSELDHIEVQPGFHILTVSMKCPPVEVKVGVASYVKELTQYRIQYNFAPSHEYSADPVNPFDEQLSIRDVTCGNRLHDIWNPSWRIRK